MSLAQQAFLHLLAADQTGHRTAKAYSYQPGSAIGSLPSEFYWTGQLLLASNSRL
jgi:hypothetical protein